MIRSFVSLAALALAAPLVAQQPTRPVPPPVADTSPFRRLELPTPTTIRTGSGAPGRDYWQQRVDYVIRATLDTAANVVSGEERITYVNNSPDTLRYLWLQLDQNLFNSRSRGAFIFDQSSRFGTRGAEGGYTIERVSEPAEPAAKGRKASPPDPLPYLVNGTMMRVTLPTPLPPRGRYAFEVAWRFPFGPNANRMGIERVDDGTVYEVAQWYPRLAVYDDVRGWNTEQYYGQGEFYLEYGSFDVRLTVPANMLVGATGTLRNPEAVLTAAQRERLALARRSDTTIAIRSVAEVADPASRPASRTGTLTWHFTADSVRDFAWAAARHFAWNAVGVNGGRTVAMSFYPPSADSIWSQASAYAKFAIEYYSTEWLPYPYPYAVNVNGVEGGMEYPGIVFCANRTSPVGLFSVTDHEFGHTWFPMVVGSNERRYAWMDEGFNTFINHYSQQRKFPELVQRRGSPGSYVPFARSGVEQPAMTPADRVNPFTLGQVAYNKPAVGLILLRERILGAERFDAAFREYIRRWAWKHPTPADFFRTIEDAAGEDLSWFWRSWFYTTETLDQAVDSVVAGTMGGQPVSRIYLRSAGPMVMPVDLELRYADGGTDSTSLPVEVWFGGSRYTYVVPGTRRLAGVTVDPRQAWPDVDRSNNAWSAAP